MGQVSWLSLGSGEGSWGPSYRPEAPSAAAAPSGFWFQSPPAGAAANLAEDLPGGTRNSRRAHRAHLTLSTLRSAAHLPGSAGRASWPSDPAGNCAGQRGGHPAPGRVPAPSSAPHPRSACAHLRHQAVRCGLRAPWGRALDGRLLSR